MDAEGAKIPKPEHETPQYLKERCGSQSGSQPPLQSLPLISADQSRPSNQPIVREFFQNVASKLASQPLQKFDSNVWGVLTAISAKARQRPQGINILLTDDELFLGRAPADIRYGIESVAVSGKHCTIYRKTTSTEGACCTSVFLKDTSTNGTYVNWVKYKKNEQAAKICHGDVISLAAAPQHDMAFAFVYREVTAYTKPDCGSAKRKAADLVSDNKRLKGLGIGAPDGPISLDDFRSLQRSNNELRKQLEDQVKRTDVLNSVNRATVEHHESEMKVLKESISKSYEDQITKLQQLLDDEQKKLKEVHRVSSEQKHVIEDLQERLSSTAQSCKEANEIINSQKASLSELKVQIDEERDQRREEREKAAADLKAAVQKAHAEAQDELKRLSDVTLRREREQQEVINKLKESDKERCLLVETLRSKLEESRLKVVMSENKVRLLESKLGDKQLCCTNERKKIEELERGIEGLQKELESEKGAREEAWAKVSSMELEINAAIKDLDFERRRLKGARERIMLRETQLRAFYSTTEEISGLFTKQQEQLKAMQRTLEDEDNYENTSFDFDLNVSVEANEFVVGRGNYGKKSAKTSSAMSAQRSDPARVETSTNEASTEKHDCDLRSQEYENTQEAEYTSADAGVKGAFGSDIDGVGTAPILEVDMVGTEQVQETESPGIYGEQNMDLNKDVAVVAGETMCVDDEGGAGETEEQAKMVNGEAYCQSQENETCDTVNAMEDTEAEGTIRTSDLLASEVAGSWAGSTVPSVHGEDESLKSGGNEDEGGKALHDSNSPVAGSQSAPTPFSKALHDSNSPVAGSQSAPTPSSKALHDSNSPVAGSQSAPSPSSKALHDSNSPVAGSQSAPSPSSKALHDSNSPVAGSQSAPSPSSKALHDSNSLVAGSQSAPSPSSKAVATRRNSEHQALSKMIGIVAPESKQFFGSRVDGCNGEEDSDSGSDTEDFSDNDDNANDNNETKIKEGRVSDSETQGVDVMDPKLDDPMDEDDEATTQEDSVG